MGLFRMREVDVPEPADGVAQLSISAEKICYIALRAREFEVKEVVADPDSGSNPTDDGMVTVLEDHADDAVADELIAFISALSEDEQVDLVALAWLGRGDAGFEEWEELRSEAARAHNDRVARYLLGMPLLPDYLEEGLSQFGHSCDES
jgi:Protein of unknown function (DUF3775)